MQRKVVIMALTIKQKQVADDFIITGNRTESYLKFYKNIKNRETAAAEAVFLVLQKLRNTLSRR